MNIVFDVGNTETVIGLFEDGSLLEHWRITTHPLRTVDELGLLVRALVRESGFAADEIRSAAIGSVVPPFTPVLLEMCERHLGVETRIIDARTTLPIVLDVDEPLGVGADRIANTLAAATLYKRDTIAVDLGTATTFDCIGRDGVFAGGVIAPGVQTGAETLVRRTARLPRVDLERPPAVVGRRTDSAVKSGIFFGAVESIDGIVRRLQAEWRRDAFVVATGGLAALIGPHCQSVQRIEPFLTLYGLDLALTHLQRRTARRGGGAAQPRTR